MTIDVAELQFDDENESKLAEHGVSVAEVLQVFTEAPQFYRNTADKRATHVMMGRTFGGRLLLVPIERLEDGLWRPVTGYEPSPHQRRRYREEMR